jgi:hypothetical protein
MSQLHSHLAFHMPMDPTPWFLLATLCLLAAAGLAQ